MYKSDGLGGGGAAAIYADYAQTVDKKTHTANKPNKYFTNDYIDNKKTVEGVFSLSGLAQKALQRAHNHVATDDTVRCRGLKKAGIALGFALTTIASAIEAIARLPIAVLGGIIGGLTMLCNKEIGGMILGITVAGFLYTATNIAQSAVSTVTHLVHHDKAIDYAGQANKHVFHETPATAVQDSVDDTML